MGSLENHIAKKGLSMMQMAADSNRPDQLRTLTQANHVTKVIFSLRYLGFVNLKVVFAGRLNYWLS